MTGDVSTAGEIILIVDDDEDARFFARRDITRAGILAQTVQAASGEAALQYFDRCAAGSATLPAVVLLDIKMPGIDGFTVLENMRHRGLLGKLTVAMLSSSLDPRDISRAMSVGAHTYLSKPPRIDDLRQVIGSAFRLRGRVEGEVPRV